MSTLTVKVPTDNFEKERTVFYKRKEYDINNNKRPNSKIYGSPKPYGYNRDLRELHFSRHDYQGIGNMINKKLIFRKGEKLQNTTFNSLQ
jgi:hypothetical protein